MSCLLLQLTSKLVLNNIDRSFFTHRLLSAPQQASVQKAFSIKLINMQAWKLQEFQYNKENKENYNTKPSYFLARQLKKWRQCVLLHACECSCFSNSKPLFLYLVPILAGLRGDMCCVHTLWWRRYSHSQKEISGEITVLLLWIRGWHSVLPNLKNCIKTRAVVLGLRSDRYILVKCLELLSSDISCQSAKCEI